MTSASWLLTRRTLIQFPRNPMVLGFSVAPVLMMFVVFGALFESVKQLPGFPTADYFEYLAPAAVLMITVPGIANAAVGLAGDFKSRYLYSGGRRSINGIRQAASSRRTSSVRASATAGGGTLPNSGMSVACPAGSSRRAGRR